MGKVRQFVKTYGPLVTLLTGTSVIAYAWGSCFGYKRAWGHIPGDGTFQELISHVVKSDDWTHGEFYDLAGTAVKNLGDMSDVIVKDGVLNEESIVTHAIIFAQK